MDIERLDRLHKKTRIKKLVLLLGFGTALLIIYWLFKFNNTNAVDFSDLWLAEVQKSNFIISVQTSGKLQAINNYIVTSKVSGIVTNINKSVGSFVQKGEVILTLDSENLKQKIKDTQYQLIQAQAKHEILTSDLKIQELNLESKIFSLKNTINIEKLKLEAKEKLNKKGIVSEIDMLQFRLKVKNLEKEYTFEQNKLKSFKQSKTSKIRADNLIIQQVQQKLKNQEKLLTSLIIKSSNEAIVNKIPVALGEHVDLGQALLELNNNKEYKAILYVNETFANRIHYNQAVIVTVLNKHIQAHISSINPKIQNHSIEIEITFEDVLPQGIRADMSITGEIISSKIPNTLWVTKPQNTNAHHTESIYVLDKSEKYISKQIVQFGEESNNKIQILNGLTKKQKIVINQIDAKNLQIIEITQ